VKYYNNCFSEISTDTYLMRGTDYVELLHYLTFHSAQRLLLFRLHHLVYVCAVSYSVGVWTHVKSQQIIWYRIVNTHCAQKNTNKQLTENSSGDEIANVNFLYDDIVHALQNTIDSCINSATDRRGGQVLEIIFTKFSEITKCNGHYAAQGHSRSSIMVPIESPYTTSY